MDRHWNTTIKRSKVFRSVKSNHSIIATWSISSSRKRRSDPLQWHHWRMQEEEVRRRFAVLTWRMDVKTGKGRRSEEKIPILCESKFTPSIPVPSSNSRTFSRRCYWSCTARQCTVTERIYRVHLPRREREWMEFHEKIISGGKKASREEDKRYSSLQWIRLMMDMVWGKLHAILRNQGSRHTRILGQCEARSRERLAILPDTVTCSRSLQHTACSLHWESGMYENSGCALPEGALNSESATSRAKKPTRNMVYKIPIERFVKLRWNL